MKKVLLSLSTLVAVAVMLVSFDAGQPKEVAKTWLTSFYHMDFEGARKVSTDDTKALLKQLSEFKTMIPDSTIDDAKNVVIAINDVKEDGDKAIVSYKALSGKKNDPGQAGTINLVRKSGQWLVQFTKNDINSGTLTGEKPGTPTLDDRTNPRSADTVNGK